MHGAPSSPARSIENTQLPFPSHGRSPVPVHPPLTHPSAHTAPEQATTCPSAPPTHSSQCTHSHRAGNCMSQCTPHSLIPVHTAPERATACPSAPPTHSSRCTHSHRAHTHHPGPLTHPIPSHAIPQPMPCHAMPRHSPSHAMPCHSPCYPTAHAIPCHSTAPLTRPSASRVPPRSLL